MKLPKRCLCFCLFGCTILCYWRKIL